jgi:hypothetical protein
LRNGSASLQLETISFLFDLEHGEIVLLHQIDYRFDLFDIFGVQGGFWLTVKRFR